jgi:ferric-dicitrate binding protein FerR (iron transport regulator)
MRDPQTIIRILWRHRQKEKLSRRDLRILRAWLMASERNQELFDDLNNPARWDQEVKAYEDQSRDGIWKLIQERMRSIPEKEIRRTIPNGWIKYAAAVLVLLLAGGEYYYYLYKSKTGKTLTQQHDKIQILPGRNIALLTLADGSVINLDSTRAGAFIQTETERIRKKDSGSLVYGTPVSAAVSSALNTLTTPAGGQYQIVLSDGSKVWLNAESSLTYPVGFNGKQRTVQLKGEAYFEVARDKSKPFRVQMPDGFVRVLGTHFNLKAYADDSAATTTLMEGSVAMGRGTDSLVIRPGEFAMIDFRGLLQKGKADTTQAIAWRNRLFLFHNASYESILRELARWYNVEVIFTHHSNQRFSGLLPRDRPLGELLSILEKEGHVQFSLEGRNLKVSPS